MVKEVEEDDALSKKQEDEEEFNSALDYLGLDKDEVTDEAFVNFKVDKEVSKKVTKLTQFSMAFRMTLEGKHYDEEKGGYRQGAKAIAGRRFIAKANGILMSYATESNLLTQKSIETFVMQYADACRKIETELLRDRSISEKNTRVIFKMFKDTLFNIGEVITGSKENMKAVFGRIEQERQDDKNLVNF
jgi:hypothetical protein